MTHNTYTVTTPDGDVEVKGLGAYHDRDALIIYTDAERQHVAAVFRRWEHVTVERPESFEHYDPNFSLSAETWFERRTRLARHFSLPESEIPPAAVWFMSDHKGDHPRNWTDDARLSSVLPPKLGDRSVAGKRPAFDVSEHLARAASDGYVAGARAARDLLAELHQGQK